MKQKNFLSLLILPVLALSLAVALPVSADWVPPTVNGLPTGAAITAPVCPATNPACHPPINVSNVTQQKMGSSDTTILKLGGNVQIANGSLLFSRNSSITPGANIGNDNSVAYTAVISDNANGFLHIAPWDNQYGKILIGTNSANKKTDVLIPWGKVGIGQIGGLNPSATLDVAGMVRARSNYGDIIEIGGDNVGNDAQINIYAPLERNQLHIWNQSLARDAGLSVGNIRISGGSPSSGKILTATDGSGNAQWENMASKISVVTANKSLNDVYGEVSVNCPSGTTVLSCTAYQSRCSRLTLEKDCNNYGAKPTADRRGCLASFDSDGVSTVEVYAYCIK